MSISGRLAWLVLATVAGALFGPGRGAVAAEDRPRAAARLNEVDEAARLWYLRRAQVLLPIGIGEADVRGGPVEDEGLTDGPITCDYVDDGGELHGFTPKFLCRRGSKTYRVKYGRSNGEVYAEIAATRLFWALGFGADAAYPVEIRCRQCPVDPWLWRTSLRHDERVIVPATVERKFPGATIESRKRGGWSWKELEEIDASVGGASAAERDALRLLAVFVQHGDNKRDQQRLVCLDEGVKRTPDGRVCTKPFLVVQDLGATFGGAGFLTRGAAAKLSFARWSRKPIFKDKERCIGDLNSSIRGSLRHPQIHEAGRRLLAERLAQLGVTQIEDLFRAARVEEKGETMEENGRQRPVTVSDWARAFLRKRAEIAEQTCPS